jgi:hypothetical protein
MARKTPKRALPAEGAAFAVPLDGRFAVCRVLLGVSPIRSQQPGENTILVAGSVWIGDHVPDAADPALRPILRLTHHSWQNQENVLWVSDPIPEAFVPISAIPPSPTNEKSGAAPWEAGKRLQFSRLRNGKWDHDRARTLAED